MAAGATLINDISGVAVARGGRARGGLGGHAHAGHARRHAATTPATTTWWPRCTPSSSTGPRAAAAPGWREVWVDPGHRLRQDRRAQPGPAGPPRPSWPRPPRHGVRRVLVGTSRKRFLGAGAGPRAASRWRWRIGWRRRWPPPPGPWWPGRGHGAGPRRGGRRVAGGTAGRPGRGRWRHEGQVGGGHPPAQLHLDRCRTAWR